MKFCEAVVVRYLASPLLLLFPFLLIFSSLSSESKDRALRKSSSFAFNFLCFREYLPFWGFLADQFFSVISCLLFLLLPSPVAPFLLCALFLAPTDPFFTLEVSDDKSDGMKRWRLSFWGVL